MTVFIVFSLLRLTPGGKINSTVSRAHVISCVLWIFPDRDFLDENRKYIYVLNYSSLNSFLSNNLGATDDLKINKPFTVYFIDDKKIALEINNEYFFIRDEITPSKYEIETLAARFDANSKYVNSVLNVEPEEFISVIKSEKTLRLTK